MTSLNSPTITRLIGLGVRRWAPSCAQALHRQKREPSLLVPPRQRLTPPWQYIRGKHLDNWTTCSTIIVDWTDRDRQIMTSHLARHELHKGDLKAAYIGKLMNRLGLSQYAKLDTSLMYQSTCINKLQSALECRLRALDKAGHVSATFVLPYLAKWKWYTRAWGSDDWNGDMTPPPRSNTTTSISTFCTAASPTPILDKPPPYFPILPLTTDVISHIPEEQNVVMKGVQDILQSGLTQQQRAEHEEALPQQLQREVQ
ncbi:Hypothetical protein NCS54_01503500 [Fusarium falciforme]|uniref:Hypothetical protein n=1 Tax=Fusarium falciforme TaxID=195108 RepID=UPI002301302B|nr:Hypothetical protein NCS54_01503500 [Fusarium falciforme]WAO97312.1 Hypothetical protein NCS54_01503500 [Fusarium falciforme]